MGLEKWSAVDAYFAERLITPDAALDEALAASEAAGLPAHNVAPNQGKLIGMLARMTGSKRILEVGTLGGYSTLWLARSLVPGGRLISLEYDPKHAEVARANIARAGLSSVVEVRVGRALDLLPQIAAEGGAPFDFVFIDADKASNAEYFQWALRLSRAGSAIVVDNVVRDGAVVDERSQDESVVGVRRLLEMLASETRVTVTAIQTVGSKGYDGFILAIVN